MAWFIEWYFRCLEEGGGLPGRESACQFWRAVVKKKERSVWQMEQWAEAMAWYLEWLECLQREQGMEIPATLASRVRAAVRTTAARRGLSDNTIKTYSGWVVRFALFCKEDRKMLDETMGRDFLTFLVEVEGLSYATQKQALNGLAFFYLDVCGREEVVVRSGKRDKDRITILPESFMARLRSHLEGVREAHEGDRANNLPPIFMPKGLGRKLRKAGVSWECFWVFPAPKIGTDPKTKVRRRHHMNPSVFQRQVKKAGAQAKITKRVRVGATS